MGESDDRLDIPFGVRGAIPPGARENEHVRRADFSSTQRLLMLAINFVPLLHVGACIAAALWMPATLAGRLTAATAVLYLAPPLLARIVNGVARIREGTLPIGSRDFFAWWTMAELQLIFNRLPFLEEALRLVPGAYSLWLRLWGARIGSLVFWGPGATVLDRTFLNLGSEVIVGAGVRLCPHVLALGAQGKLELQLATITVGDRACIGGYSILGAGTEIAAGESTLAGVLSTPYSVWIDGRRRRK